MLSCVWLFCNPMDCSLPGSSVHGDFQARILKWLSISFSRGSSQPRGQTHVSCIGRWILYHWATRKTQVWAFSQFSSVAQSCPTCDPMDCSVPGFPVHHQLPEVTQTLVHRVSDAKKSSHLLSSSSPPAFNLSQNQGLFKWVSSSHQVAKVLEFQLQHQSFQWIFRTNFLQDWLVWTLKLYKTYMRKMTKHSWKTKYILKQMEKAPSFCCWILEKEMATHSSTIAWKMQLTEEPGRLQSMGSQRVRHDWATSFYFLLNINIQYNKYIISS